MLGIIELLLKLALAVLPGLINRYIDKKEASVPAREQTAPEALLKVAEKEAKVQNDINKITAKALPVADALNRLQSRAAASAAICPTCPNRSDS